jgi:hypothetical protein
VTLKRRNVSRVSSTTTKARDRQSARRGNGKWQGGFVLFEVNASEISRWQLTCCFS